MAWVTAMEGIIDAASEAIAERGYRETTIEAIASEAGVSVDSFHRHFSDKEECFLAAFDSQVDAIIRLLTERVDPGLAWPERIAAGIEIVAEALAARPARARLCLVAPRCDGAAAFARYRATLELIELELGDGRLEAGRSGDALPACLETTLVGGLAWLVEDRLLSGGGQRLRESVPEMIRLVLTRYVGPERAGVAAGLPMQIARS